MQRTCLFSFVLSVVWLTSILTWAQELNISGLITQRFADVLIVRSEQGDRSITLTDAARIRAKGVRARKQQMLWAELIPGLRVSVKAILNDGKLTARTINFTNQDLQSIRTIGAGLVRRQEKVDGEEAGTSERFSALSDYDVKDHVGVEFYPGKSEIVPADQMALSTMAAEAAKHRGYMIEINGFAESTRERKLSRRRTEAVVTFLMEECQVPARHIVASGAMDTSTPATPREESRRFEARVLMNRTIAADTQ